MPRDGPAGPASESLGRGAARPRVDTHRAGAVTKHLAMIQRQVSLGLPLMDHLVQECVVHRRPAIPAKVAIAHGDLRTWEQGVHGQLSEPGSHAPRDAKRHAPQLTAKTPAIQLCMPARQLFDEGKIVRAHSWRSARGGSVKLNGEGDNFVARRAAPFAEDAGPQESDDGPQHPIGSRAKPLVQPKDTAGGEGDDDGAVPVQHDALDAPEPKGCQPSLELCGGLTVRWQQLARALLPAHR